MYDIRESSKVGNATEKEQDQRQSNNKLYTFTFASIIHSQRPPSPSVQVQRLVVSSHSPA